MDRKKMAEQEKYVRKGTLWGLMLLGLLVFSYGATRDYKAFTKVYGETIGQAEIGGIVSDLILTRETTYPNRNYVFKYSPIDNLYAIERNTKIGEKVAELKVGEELELRGEKYKVTEIHENISTEEGNQSEYWKIVQDGNNHLQTCESKYSSKKVRLVEIVKNIKG